MPYRKSEGLKIPCLTCGGHSFEMFLFGHDIIRSCKSGGSAFNVDKGKSMGSNCKILRGRKKSNGQPMRCAG